MIWTTWTALCLSLLAVFLATFAVVVALRSSEASLSKVSREHSTRLTDLEDSQEALSAAIKNMRVARNMAAYRARKTAEEPEATDPAADARTKLNRDLAAGRISPMRPRT